MSTVLTAGYAERFHLLKSALKYTCTTEKEWPLFFVTVSRPCSARGHFDLELRFSSLLKTNISKFKYDPEYCRRISFYTPRPLLP